MRPRVGAHAAPLLTLLTVLLLLPTAEAVTISATNVFAQTRSETVSWKTASTLNVNSLSVDSDSITIDSADLDFEPASGSLTVTIAGWGATDRRFDFAEASTVLVTFRMTNTGGKDWTLYLGGTPSAGCAATLATCTWILPTGTTSLRAGVGTYSAAAAGGEDIEDLIEPEEEIVVDEDTGEVRSGSGALLRFPNPIKLFPHFGILQWFTFGVGMTFLFTGPSLIQYNPFARPLRLERLPSKLAKSLGTSILLLLYFGAI